MNEQEWLSSSDPKSMLHWVTRAGPGGSGEADLGRWRRRPSDRKLRLFACACHALSGRPLTPEYRQMYPDGAKAASNSEGDALVLALAWVTDDAAGRGDPPPPVMAALLRDMVGNPFRPPTLSPVGPGWAALGEPWKTPYEIALAAYGQRDWGRLPVLADALEDAGCDCLGLLLHLRGRERCPRCLGKGEVVVWDTGAERELNRCDVAPNPRGLPTCRGTGTIALRGPHARGCWALDLILQKE